MLQSAFEQSLSKAAAMHRELKITRNLLICHAHRSLNVQLLDPATWAADDMTEHGRRQADIAARLYPWPAISD